MTFLPLLRVQPLTPVPPRPPPPPLPPQDRLLTQLDSEMDTTSSRLRATTKKASGWPGASSWAGA